MKRVYARLFQRGLKVGMNFLPWREPELLVGPGSVEGLAGKVKSLGLDNVFIITDRNIAKLGLLDVMLLGLDSLGIKYLVYDQTVANPTIVNIEEARGLYVANECQALIAFGGGSPIDCAKAVGARIARPEKQIPELKGLFHVRKRIPTLFTVPTTAGSGSEATLAAVVTNSETHEKYAINDTSLIPHYAVLDPLLTMKLPPAITAATGMDALTHAVEAYIGNSNTKDTWNDSRAVVQLVFTNLYEAYRNGDNLTARTNMQRASYLAGKAFTRAYVGNIHAIAHTLSGFYNVPHGLANAIILPHVLEYYGKTVYTPLSELADLIGVTNHSDTKRMKAEKFIEAIRALNHAMNIPERMDGIMVEDIPLMVKRASAEANPLYPVPKILRKKEFMELYDVIRV
ncbi:alcohol dehydrogenase [Sporosarcina sp. P16a]|uniref:iron-containing alcohol dehydrogenase n=1 Tax=unclassified Sporosarcina TaxID=2647733 RepID=UPI000C16C07A|nr:MULTISPECIES: iron-containing alcohol dehydrogenase [unclassified Sporosarcina]PIC66792.1 alcohol dehydrogenase [Sporosarcina sp. P16a]PIC94208.1 alcohol dehydrogenase [Sporosarcina sp. P25]